MRWTRRPDGSNWGDFGPDDQRGRMNLVTPELRRRAAAEIREGIAFCLSLPLDYPGGSALSPNRRPPQLSHGLRNGEVNYNFALRDVNEKLVDVLSDDAAFLYLQYSSQWDSFAHVGQTFDADGDGVAEKVYYNGFRAGTDIVPPGPDAPDGGARALGIENLAETCAQGRGVLVDLEAIHGRARAMIGYDALMRAIEAQRVEVGTGDFLCLHTGFGDLILSMDKQPDGDVLASSCAVLDGRDTALLDWIDRSGIVAICADNYAVEAYPARRAEGETFPALPLHNHCLFKLGLHLAELWYLGDLARWLRANGRSSFFLTAPPLRLPGAVGSPVTPVATV